MGIHHALYSAVSGLSVNSDAMGVISNNVANSNTKAFKTDRAEFEDMLSISLNENSQLGRGAKLRNITTQYTQGALSNTGLLTDFSIQGDGFFMVKNNATEVQEAGGMFYTRQGSMRFDKDGFLSDVSGGKLQGYMVQEDGKLSPRLSDVQIQANSIPPKSSSKVTIAANLDAREKSPVEPFDPKRPGETSNYATVVTIYDNWGTGHNCTVYFRKTEEADKNNWEWHAMVDGQEISNQPELDAKGKPIAVEIGKGEIKFDEEGRPELPFKTKAGKPTYYDASGMSDAFEVTFANGAKPQKIQFNFGPHDDEGVQVGSQTTVSLASNSSSFFHSQNGYESGSLKTLKVDLDGTIRGVYTNGLERKLAAVGLATFANNNGLQKVGRNSFIRTSTSGEPQIGRAQTGSRGSLYASTLEESNVDLAQQFVDLITTQRGFQANSKAVTTADTLLEEIINLKR